ncbi:DUF2726 domain-containing protein [Undibacterium sp.]|uniref:DUF2726 domain-containing protein n=1 Tax=Undibacterium sp. TaxID=1914977 RepID=UPI00374CBA0C
MNTTYLIYALVIFALAAAGWFFYNKKNKGQFDFRKKKPLTEAEEQMYWKLVQALPHHVVLTKVSLPRILSSSTVEARSSIMQKSLDFLICDKDFTLIAAIDIEDKSPSGNKKRAEEAKKFALDKAGIKLIKWKSSALPTDVDILSRVLGLRPKAPALKIVPSESFNTENGATG